MTDIYLTITHKTPTKAKKYYVSEKHCLQLDRGTVSCGVQWQTRQ